MNASQARSLLELLKPHVVIAISTGSFLGMIYAVGVWALWEAIYPDRLTLATIAGLVANAIATMTLIVTLAKLRRLKLSLISEVLELSLAHLLAFLTSAIVIFDILSS